MKGYIPELHYTEQEVLRFHAMKDNGYEIKVKEIRNSRGYIDGYKLQLWHNKKLKQEGKETYPKIDRDNFLKIKESMLKILEHLEKTFENN